MMARGYPAVAFERYGDDVVVHYVSERHARSMCTATADRLAEVGLAAARGPRLRCTKCGDMAARPAGVACGFSAGRH